MKGIFGFCLRFFIGFVVAKLLLRAFAADTPGYILLLSLLITLNLYWFDLSQYSHRYSSRQNSEQKDKRTGE
jgi:hypothetical protein